jgi:hypothetical protein
MWRKTGEDIYAPSINWSGYSFDVVYSGSAYTNRKMTISGFTTNRAHVICMSIDVAGDTAIAYVDGVSYTVSKSVTAQATMAKITAASSSVSLAFAAVWSKQLSPDKTLALTLDPYQFLIPA